MSAPLLIIGTRAIAKALGVSRGQVLGWLADPEIRLPVTRAGARGRWITSQQCLQAWSGEFFSREARPRLEKP